MAQTKHIPLQRVLPPDIEETLLQNIVAAQPTPGQRDAMRQKMLSLIRDTPKTFLTVRGSEREWTEVLAGVFRKLLADDGKFNVSLYRMMPGSTFPAHDHPSDEECFCLHGEFSTKGIVVRAGDLHVAPQGQPHGSITSSEGCLLYIRTGSTAAVG